MNTPVSPVMYALSIVSPEAASFDRHRIQFLHHVYVDERVPQSSEGPITNAVSIFSPFTTADDLYLFASHSEAQTYAEINLPVTTVWQVNVITFGEDPQVLHQKKSLEVFKSRY